MRPLSHCVGASAIDLGRAVPLGQVDKVILQSEICWIGPGAFGKPVQTSLPSTVSASMIISELVLRRLNQDYLLPSVQREFVWGRKERKIEKLFDSILQEYPIGSIMIWPIIKDSTTNAVSLDVYQFVTDYDEDDPHNQPAGLNGKTQIRLVLDGQQRLTALNIGLIGSYSFTRYGRRRREKLYIDLFADLDQADDNPADMKYDLRFFERAPDGRDTCWFEVGKVLDDAGSGTEPFKKKHRPFIVSKCNGDVDLEEQALSILGLIHQVICRSHTIHEIEVATSDEEKILNIFVRTNDGGVQLQKSDLLLSFMESEKSLFRPAGARREVNDFVDRLNEERVAKPDFGISKDDVLKAALVLTGANVRYQLQNFSKTNLQTIDAQWPQIKQYLEMAVLLLARYGFSAKNLVSKNAVIPLALYMKHHASSTSFVDSQGQNDLNVKQQLIKWLINALLTGLFGASSDTTLTQIRKDIIAGTNLSVTTKLQAEDIDRIIAKEGYNSRYSHLVLMLICSEHHWDRCHQDHLFPASKFTDDELSAEGIPQADWALFKKNANTLGNLHLLSPSVNIVKSASSFIDWSNKQNDALFDRSLVPRNMDLSFSNFPNFVAERTKLIRGRLEKLLC